jgi:hypothetical protein
MQHAKILSAAFATVALMGGCAATTSRPAQVTSPAYGASGYAQPGYGGAQTAQVVEGDVIQPGTQLTLRMNEAVGTDVSRPGQRFSASVVTPVIDRNGVPIIPAGAEVLGYVAEIREGNQTGTAPLLSLAFDGLRIGGTVHPFRAHVVSADVETERRGVRGRHVAAGALGGAVLGAVAGGALGAGTGAGASYLTDFRQQPALSCDRGTVISIT